MFVPSLATRRWLGSPPFLPFFLPPQELLRQPAIRLNLRRMQRRQLLLEQLVSHYVLDELEYEGKNSVTRRMIDLVER